MSRESALAAVSRPAPTEGATLPVEDADPAAQAAGADAARFAALARKEAQLVKDREAFKAEQAAALTEKEQARVILKKQQDFEQAKTVDPVAALRGMGFSETDILNFLAAQPEKKEPTPEERAVAAAEAAAAAKIKEFQDAEAKKAEEAQTKTDNEMIDGLKSELTKLIEANKETYEYCAHFGEQAQALAYEIIVLGLKESGGTELIEPKEAVQMAEAFYEEKDKAMSTLKKRQPAGATEEKTAAAPERSRTVTPGDPNFKQAPTITRTRTLSNATGATAANSIPKNETREQKKDRLIAQIKANGLRK